MLLGIQSHTPYETHDPRQQKGVTSDFFKETHISEDSLNIKGNEGPLCDASNTDPTHLGLVSTDGWPRMFQQNNEDHDTESNESRWGKSWMPCYPI